MVIAELLKTKGRNVVSLLGSTRLSKAVQVMTQENIGAIVVVDGGGQLQGLLAEREIVAALACGGAAVLGAPVHNWMRRNAQTIAPDTPVRDVMAVITRSRARHLPVVDRGQVVGLLSVGDLLKSRLDEKTQENLVLMDVARWPQPKFA